MKLNWGTSIAIFYGSFMAILLFFVIRSTTYPHSLVMDNYYEQDLQYQDHYQKISNANDLGTKFRIDYEGTAERLSIYFPKTQNVDKGTITLFKPADSEQDIEGELIINSDKVMTISTKGLSKGHWKVQVDWEADGKSYYRETKIYF